MLMKKNNIYIIYFVPFGKNHEKENEDSLTKCVATGHHAKVEKIT